MPINADHTWNNFFGTRLDLSTSMMAIVAPSKKVQHAALKKCSARKDRRSKKAALEKCGAQNEHRA
jgi:hypothetical protein